MSPGEWVWLLRWVLGNGSPAVLILAAAVIAYRLDQNLGDPRDR